jgi:hypothetical protein
MKKQLNFDFDTSLRNEQLMTCESCAHSWISENEPYRIKRGMVVVEDVCPSCGDYISKSI